MSMKRSFVAAAAAALAALSAVAVDLPWVYDSSDRTVVDVKSVAAANHRGTFATMVGHWSYTSTTSYLRTVPWEGLTIIVR